MKNIKTIAFDADDTLWVNEPIYNQTQERLKSLIEKFVTPEVLEQRLYQTEIKNLRLFGYGIKAFMLSMVETAIELSNGKISGEEIGRIIDLGKDMIEHPVQVLPNVKESLEQLQSDFELMIITKGDLFDQESKIARSGLADFFSKIEIVSEKDETSYKKVLSKHGIAIHEFIMIGNSLKSDVLPVFNIGGKAIHIPFHTTWQHETIEAHHFNGIEYQELPDISLVPGFFKNNR